MDDLMKEKERLKQRQETLQPQVDTYYEIEKRIHELQSKMDELSLHLIDEPQKQFLIQRLEKIKAQVDACSHCQINYRIHKKTEPRVDDYHNPLPDYIEYTIHDFELLDMSYHVEIHISIYSDVVKKFVQDWLTVNVPSMNSNGYMCHQDIL